MWLALAVALSSLPVPPEACPEGAPFRPAVEVLPVGVQKHPLLEPLLQGAEGARLEEVDGRPTYVIARDGVLPRQEVAFRLPGLEGKVALGPLGRKGLWCFWIHHTPEDGPDEWAAAVRGPSLPLELSLERKGERLFFWKLASARLELTRYQLRPCEQSCAAEPWWFAEPPDDHAEKIEALFESLRALDDGAAAAMEERFPKLGRSRASSERDEKKKPTEDGCPMLYSTAPLPDALVREPQARLVRQVKQLGGEAGLLQVRGDKPIEHESLPLGLEAPYRGHVKVKGVGRGYWCGFLRLGEVMELWSPGVELTLEVRHGRELRFYRRRVGRYLRATAHSFFVGFDEGEPGLTALLSRSQEGCEPVGLTPVAPAYLGLFPWSADYPRCAAKASP